MKLRLSKVSKNAIKGTFAAGLISLIITMLFTWLFYSPQLHQNTDNILRTSSHETVQEITEAINDLIDYANFVGEHALLSHAMEGYIEFPSKENEQEIVRILTEMKNISKHIRSYSLELSPTESRDQLSSDFEYGYRIYSKGNFVQEDRDYLDTNFFNGEIYHNNTLQDSGLYNIGDITILALSHIYNIAGVNCSLTIQYDASEMMYTVKQLTESYFTGYTIYDEENTAVWAGGETEDSSNLVLSHMKDYEISPSTKGYYIINNVDVNGWHVVGFIDTYSYYSLFIYALTNTIFLCILLSIITALLTAISINRTIKPIGHLNMAMHEVVNGDFTVRSSVHTKDEIGELSSSFNSMLEHLNQSIDARLKHEENEQRMKHSLLISQIDRHFVYNTMSIINSFARRGKTAEVIKANSALSKILFNYLCIQDMDVTDTVSREMDVVNAYWAIEKLRPNNHVELIWSIPDELIDTEIPKNLIQPLVENSLRHGLADRDTGDFNGIISIDISQTEDTIEIIVSDNGVGIPEEKLRYINEFVLFDTIPIGQEGHIALANIRCRLWYMYKENCLSIVSQNGTIVTITLQKDK